MNHNLIPAGSTQVPITGTLRSTGTGATLELQVSSGEARALHEGRSEGRDLVVRSDAQKQSDLIMIGQQLAAAVAGAASLVAQKAALSARIGQLWSYVFPDRTNESNFSLLVKGKLELGAGNYGPTPNLAHTDVLTVPIIAADKKAGAQAFIYMLHLARATAGLIQAYKFNAANPYMIQGAEDTFVDTLACYFEARSLANIHAAASASVLATTGRALTRRPSIRSSGLPDFTFRDYVLLAEMLNSIDGIHKSDVLVLLGLPEGVAHRDLDPALVTVVPDHRRLSLEQEARLAPLLVMLRTIRNLRTEGNSGSRGQIGVAALAPLVPGYQGTLQNRSASSGRSSSETVGSRIGNLNLGAALTGARLAAAASAMVERRERPHPSEYHRGRSTRRSSSTERRHRSRSRSDKHKDKHGKPRKTQRRSRK